MNFNFDTSSLPPADSFDPLPPGWYTMVISGASEQEPREGSDAGTMLKLEHEIDPAAHPQFAGRKVWSVQVSIDGLRAIAERTGLYAGQDEPEFVDGPEGPTGLPVACKVRVYRKDWTRPAVGIAYWAEAVQVSRDKTTGKERPSAMWARMPRLMLAKVAEALALRKAFPEDTSGLYTGDEIQEASESAEEARRLPAPSMRALAAPPARSLPPLGALGIEAAPAMPEIDLGATQPLTEREGPGLRAEIASASSEACICAGVPSNRRPQPAENRVSPQNSARPVTAAQISAPISCSIAAIANSTAKAANFGMVLATPP